MEIKDRELHRITMTAIIYNNSGKYLIVQRSLNKKVFPGKWTVPGGGLEVDDYINSPPTNKDGQWYYALENALKREIKEEVNLEIGKANYLLDIVFIRPDGIPVLILSYYCPLAGGEVKLNNESVDYKWVSVKEAKNYDLIDGIWEEIKMVDDILKPKS